MPTFLVPDRSPTAPTRPAAPAAGVSANATPPDALGMLAEVLAARDPESAAHALAAGLKHELGLELAAVGTCGRDGTRLRAVAGVELAALDPRRRDLLQGAMDEAAAHGAPLTADGTALDASAVRAEQRALQRETGGHVATLPFGADGTPWGAVVLLRPAAAAPFDVPALERLAPLLALAGPALHWRVQAQAPLGARLADAWRDARRALRHPSRRVARRMLAAAGATLLVLAIVPMPRTVGGRARLEGAQQRVVTAPADGFVKAARARPGDRVRAGDPLVDLVDADLQLERERTASQRAQHENAYAAAMAKADRAGAATSLARLAEADAQLALLDEQISRGRVVAPFDGLVIQGDLAQSGGAPVKQGDTLMTVAATGHYRVVVEVDETDIADVRAGQSGALSLSTGPWGSRPLVVERVAPLAKAVEGRNVFEVQARLAEPDARVEADPVLRPGLLGRATLDTGRSPPLWTWIGRLAARVRVAWWGWFG